ncbi:sulfatase-like hydrolase/transferase [Rubritalea tangerina]
MKFSLHILKLFTFFFISYSSLTKADSKPNIILIMADDIGVECFSSYGGKDTHTEHLDALAASGQRFKQCYSQPLCTPSRVQIMTGRYNNRNYQGFGWLDPKEVTFANLLKKEGYSTCIAGKWQLGGNEKTIQNFGFDEHCLWNMHKYKKSDKTAIEEPKDWLRRFDNPTLYRNGQWYQPGEKSYGPEVCTDFICDFIGQNREKPFLVYYPMILTHSPFDPTPDSKSRKQDIKQNFTDMTHFMDKMVGRIVAKLEQEGIRDNTLIIFTTDNGTHSKIKSNTDKGVIQGGKNQMTDAGTHVPLIINWPGKIKPALSSELVDFSDILPTLVETAGAELPKDRHIDGKSLLPVLEGKVNSRRETIFCYYWDYGRNKAKARAWVRNERYKLYDDGSFFDITADKSENEPLKEISATQQTIKANLQTALQGYLQQQP